VVGLLIAITIDEMNAQAKCMSNVRFFSEIKFFCIDCERKLIFSMFRFLSNSQQLVGQDIDDFLGSFLFGDLLIVIYIILGAFFSCVCVS